MRHFEHDNSASDHGVHRVRRGDLEDDYGKGDYGMTGLLHDGVTAGARPAPGTTDLLEVLDRALTGGIAVASDRRINVVTLARASYRARVVVTTTEIYLRHPEPEAEIRPPARVVTDRVQQRPRQQPQRRHG